MANFKSDAKRKRELAKLDKRHAKDQKRALRKAERSGADVGVRALAVATQSHHRPAFAPTPASKPMTLAEAAERWRNTKVVKPKKR
jgi:hypothetical protein